MTASDGKGVSMVGEAARMDRFPVGMRVLAVDDDPVCLKLLECLLLRCQYHVTTTNQAITALKLLRENRDKFDLVISDVHMPDMDGFKLLELVGLEMDLPVIMLSVNGETKTVMKGITHGACDYLLKPVRIEELRNIWQHVVRRRKFDYRINNSCDHRETMEKPQNANSESGKVPMVKGSSDHNEKSSRKRKDMSDEDEDDSDENPPENEDPSTHKKPRVVWSIDLHRKFVAAVNQLGIDKAVPKRILELMNVDKLTRENVASHLQKYRLYLKRLSAVASQQANLVAAFGGRDASCLHMGSLDGFGNLQALATSGQLPVLTSCQTTGMLSRPTTTGLGFHSLVPASIDPAGHTLNNTSIPLISKLRQIDGPGNQQGSLLHGIPTSLEPERLQSRRIQEATSHLPVDFSHSGLRTSSTSFLDITKDSLPSHPPKQQRDSRDLMTHSSMAIPPMSSDPYHINTGSSPHLPGLDKRNNTWQAATPLTGYIASDLSMAASTCDELSRIPIHASKRQRDDKSISNDSCDIIVAPQLDPFKGNDTKCQVNSFIRTGAYMPVTTDGESNLLNFGRHESKQKLEEPKQDHAVQYELEYGSLSNISSSGILLCDSVHGNQRMNFSHHKNISNGNMISNVNASSSVPTQMPKTNNLMVDPEFKYKDEDIVGVTKTKSELLSNDCILDDLVGSMIKLERDEITFMDNDISYDFYPLGACM